MIDSGSRPTCFYPGCQRPARRGVGLGAPPRYCDLGHHNPGSAEKQRARLLARRNLPALADRRDPGALRAYIAELRRELAAVIGELDVERGARRAAEHRLAEHQARHDAGPDEPPDEPG